MLKEIIDKFYLDKQKDRKQEHFYISDAGKCSRQIFFKFKNAPKKEMEARILRIFDHGDDIHKLIMKPLFGTRDAHVVASEVDIPSQEIISGRADAIISDGVQLYVLDIKSINTGQFRSLIGPKEEHINQTQLYLHYFKVKKGILLYVNKDNQELKEFIFNYDQERVQILLNGLNNLKKQVDANTIPARMSGYPSIWQCRYCQYKEICRMAEAEEMNWEDFKKTIEAQEVKEG